MSKVVVDSSVVIKWFVLEPYSNEARQVLREYEMGVLNLLAPDFMLAEFGNILWKKRRFQGLQESDAQLIIDAFRRLTFVLTPTSVLLEEAYRLAISHQCTVYDALYLALSVREQCRFVTADRPLVNSVGTSLPGVIWVKNWT